MIFDMVLWRRLGLATAAVALLSLQWAHGVPGPRGRRHQPCSIRCSASSACSSTRNRIDRLSRQGADRGSTPHRSAAAEGNRSRSVLARSTRDVVEERRRAMDSRRPAPQINPNSRVEMSQTELQQQGRAALPSNPGGGNDCQAGAGTPICLYAPWKVLQAAVTGAQPDVIQPGPEPSRKFLTEPPPGYRKATGVAKATVEAPKDRPDSADPQAFIRSQRHKSSID